MPEMVNGSGGTVTVRVNGERVTMQRGAMLAAALRSVAPLGGVMIAASTKGLLGGLFEYEAVGPFALDGFPNPIAAWRVTSPSEIESRFEALHPTGLTDLIGREEETEMLPKATELDIDFEALGQRMLARKKDLQKNGVPPDAEHAMVAKANGKGDSPAAAAKRAKTPRKSKMKAGFM